MAGKRAWLISRKLYNPEGIFKKFFYLKRNSLAIIFKIFYFYATRVYIFITLLGSANIFSRIWQTCKI